MFSTITSGTIYCIRSCLVQVEVDISQGLPCFQIVGLPGSEVREARERVKVALKNVGIALPPVCVNVNLSPADIPKSGTMFDLPVAAGIMTALGKLPQIAPANFAYIFAKRCVSQFAAEQAVELGKRGIRVNNVMPGSTQTGMKDEFEKLAGGKEALLAETGVAHRLAAPEEMAAPIVFLGSDMCSFVSGVDLCVDSADRTMKVLKLKKDVANVSATNPLVLKIAKKMMDKQNRK